MIITHVQARDIPDAWFQCISTVLDVGFKYKIQHGSFVGQTRLEFDFVTVDIKYSYSEPYDSMLPVIPEHLGIPNPVANGYIEGYLPYLMTSSKKVKEDYTYGQRLTNFEIPFSECNSILKNISHEVGNQIEYFVRLLRDTSNTNQAILQVAQPSDCLLDDPPCLRHIDMRIKNDKLIFYPYFRSWDLWGGFPANLAAIAVLQKYMADEIGVDIGNMVSSSKGLHIYGYVEDLAKLRCYKGGL